MYAAPAVDVVKPAISKDRIHIPQDVPCRYADRRARANWTPIQFPSCGQFTSTITNLLPFFSTRLNSTIAALPSGYPVKAIVFTTVSKTPR